MKLDEGYILIYYLIFLFFFFNITCFSAVLHSRLSCNPLIETGLLAFLVKAKYLQLFPWGWLELLLLLHCPIVYLPYGTDCLCSGVAGRGFLGLSQGRRKEIALLSKISGNKARALLASAQR